LIQLQLDLAATPSREPSATTIPTSSQQSTCFQGLRESWVALLGLLLAAPMARAASRPAFVWQGMVDGVVEIAMHGREVRARPLEGSAVEDPLWRLSKPLPAETALVSLSILESRGFVHVVSQPTLRNGYTLVIRLEDRQDGRSLYRFAANWESGMEQVARATQSPVSVATELPESPLEKKHRSERPPKPKRAKDARWEENGRPLKITGRAIWEGTVRGTARIAVSERGASVLSGDANGRLEWIGAQSDIKAGNARVLSFGAGHVKLADAASAPGGYTLTIEVTGGPGQTSFELAW